jgi:hypothetical protein
MEMLAQDQELSGRISVRARQTAGSQHPGINHALERLGVTYKKACVTPKPAKKSSIFFGKKLKAMSAKAALSFTLMKAVLGTTYRARMAMRQWVSAPMA